jgi:cell shape-determining protein MreD
MAILIGILLFGGLAIIESAVTSRMPLLHGMVDLILLALTAWALQERVKSFWQWGLIGGLFATLTSALPFGVYLGGYLLIIALARLLRRQVWRVPFMAMLVTVFVGTLLVQGLAWGALVLFGHPLPIISALNLVIVPSLLLNLLLAVPVYVLVSDLAKWLYPEELEV